MRNAFIAGAAVGLCGVIVVAQPSGPLRPVALTGTDGSYGPNLGPGVTFESFVVSDVLGAPSIASNGAVAFGGSISGSGVTGDNNTGIWAARGGPTLTVIARRGDQVPALPAGVVFSDLNTFPQVCDTGAVTFMGSIVGPGVTDTSNTCFFIDRDGALQALVREGVTPVPDSPTPVLFAEVGNAGNRWCLNRSGLTSFRGFIDHPDAFGLYVEREGALRQFFRRGQPIEAGSLETCGGGGEPRMNASGAIIATMLLGGAGSGDGLFTDRAEDASGFGTAGVGVLQAVARTGELAPGTGNVFGTLLSNSYSMNANGRVAFRAEFAPPGPGQGGGLWSDARFGALQLIAQSGTAAPGVPGEAFNTSVLFVIDSSIADNNVVVMLARLNHSGNVSFASDTGLWSTRTPGTGAPGNLRLVLREGDPVPPSAGPDYTGLAFGEVSRFWVNDSGLLTFLVQHNDFTNALWQEQPDGTLAPIVKEFTQLDINGDGTDSRLITAIDVVQGSAATGDGRRNALNDNNDVAAHLTFADGSEGIFTTAPPIAACPCETDDAPGVNVFDLLAYLDLWFPADPAADIDGAPGVSVFDLLAYLDCWFPASAGAACP